MSSWYFCLLYLLVTVYVAMCESSRLAIERLRVQILPVATVYQRQITMTSLWGRLMSTRESWGVNGHTTRCTIPISVVLWLRLASGWGLRKWRSVPLCGPLRIGIDFTFTPCFSLHMYACAWHVGVRLRSHWHEYESRVRVSIYGSYKLHPYEWAFMVTCTRTTQRVSTDNLQKNRIDKMLCEKVTIFH